MIHNLMVTGILVGAAVLALGTTAFAHERSGGGKPGEKGAKHEDMRTERITPRPLRGSYCMSTLARFAWWFLLVMVGGFPLACSFVPTPDTVPLIANSPPSIAVDVRRMAGQDLWRVCYRLASSAESLVFDRQLNRFRESHWKVLTPHVRLASIDGQEMLQADSGTSFREVCVEFASFTENLPKDYNFFERYSDGGYLLFTGHLNAHLAGKDARDSKGRPAPIEFRFTGAPGDRLVLPSQTVADATAVWVDKDGKGTYVYFGVLSPIESRRLVAVVDSGMPSWLKNKAFELLPRLFDYYASRLGEELPFRPTVFFSYVPNDAVDMNSSGGVVGDVIQLAIEGRGWTEQSDDAQQQIWGFLAHESSHLWNGRLFHHAGDPQWMHEGSAEAFKARALLDFGLIDRDMFLNLHRNALIKCVDSLSHGSLAKAGIRRDFEAFYSCGMVLSAMTESAIRRRSPGSSIYTFWKTLFARAAENHNEYTEDMYLDVLQELSADPELMLLTRQILQTSFENPTEALQALLQRADLPSSMVRDGLPASMQRRLSVSLLRQLMAADCNGRMSFTTHDRYIEIDGMPQCRTLNTTLSIDRIGTHSLMTDGASAYDAAFESCLSAKKVALGFFESESIVELPCSPIKERKPSLVLQDVRYP